MTNTRRKVFTGITRFNAAKSETLAERLRTLRLTGEYKEQIITVSVADGEMADLNIELEKA